MPLVFTSLENLRKETNKNPLTGTEKRSIISAARSVLSDLNVNRKLQLNLHKYDVIAKLDRLERRLKRRNRRRKSNLAFHRSMQTIFAGMNDRHSTYISPTPLINAFAFLGFFATEFFVPGDNDPDGMPRRRYIAYDVPLKTTQKGMNSSFAEGVELLMWNGQEVDKVVQRLGENGFGSNFASKIASGVLLLSFRSLAFEKVPLESTVRIGYKNKYGYEDSVELPWLFFQEQSDTKRSKGRLNESSSDNSKRHNVLNGTTSAADRILPMLGKIKQTAKKISPSDSGTRIEIRERFASLFAAEIVQTQFGKVGRLFLPSFNANVSNGLVAELTRVLKLMPETGLVLDVRKNRGGQSDFAKTLVELVSNVTVPDQDQAIRASDLMGSLLFFDETGINLSDEELEILKIQRIGVATALRAGEEFTGPGIGLWPPRERQDQVYFGPIITVADGLTYSAGDVFALFQVDLEVSPLVLTSDNIGAGGASTTTYSALVEISPDVFPPLPQDVDFFFSSSRYYRTGWAKGALVESFGVEPDIRYYPTRNDALQADVDLFDFLAKNLVSKSLLQPNSNR